MRRELSVNKSSVITIASPHTIKKFELIEMYIKSWAQKMMNNDACNEIIYIDCMCNSGVYKDKEGHIIQGTSLRVANALLEVAHSYTSKMVSLYLNDLDPARVEELEKHLPDNERNFKIITSHNDASELLGNIGPQLTETDNMHYLLLYDPYNASIDWKALFPFFRHWGEVMINHAVRDPMRAIKSAKSKTAKEKYARTYLEDFEKLVPYGSDKTAYEKRISEIINYMKGNRRYFVAAYPFYNTKNSQLYDLIHCTSNIEGFKLYKHCAWKVFGGKSSTKTTNTNYVQMKLDFSDQNSEKVMVPTDETCYTILDIAKYLQNNFCGRKNVPVSELWELLIMHPIFPSDCFRNEIKHQLKTYYGDDIYYSKSSTTSRRCQMVSFTTKKG